MYRFSRVLASSIALATSLAACSTYPTQPPAAPAGAAETASPNRVATGTIRLNLGQLFGAGSQRRTLGYGLAADRITHVRLRIQSPGQSEPTLLTPTPVPLDTSSTLNKTVECTVAAGPNQVVTVEALDAAGDMLMRLRAATNVPASGAATIQVGILQDSVARVIERLINDGATFLDSTALIGALTTYMSNLATHLETVPQYLDDRQIAQNNFSTWDSETGQTNWWSADTVLAWLADSESLDLVGTPYEPYSTFALALDKLADPDEFPSEDYDPTEWKATLIAPIQGVWNAYEDVPFEPLDGESGIFLQEGPGHYLKITGMPPGKFTLMLSHPTNDTKLVFDLGGGFDGFFYFDPVPREAALP